MVGGEIGRGFTRDGNVEAHSHEHDLERVTSHSLLVLLTDFVSITDVSVCVCVCACAFVCVCACV